MSKPSALRSSSAASAAGGDVAARPEVAAFLARVKAAAPPARATGGWCSRSTRR